MYEVLGDSEAQQRIRVENPQKVHCHFLKQSSRACWSLPGAAPENLRGQPCPHNPHYKHRDKVSALAPRMGQINRSLELLEEVELGFDKDLGKSDREIVKIARNFMEQERRSIFAKEVAFELGKVLAELFKTKEGKS